MPAVVDKVVVANGVAMQTKYGAAGLASVRVALQRLIAADAARGLATLIVYVDDAGQMNEFGGGAVVGPQDERGAKAAVDAICAALSPDYVLLLDGPDVIPHILLDPIQGLADGDRGIPSDLPYASTAGWSRRASNFLAVTRALGRLPAPEGDPDASHLTTIIDAAAAHQPRSPGAFQQPFGLSAAVWTASTQLSLSTTFGPGTPLGLSPPEAHPGIDTQLSTLAHFINCHGAEADPRFYGQLGTSYPTAVESRLLSPRISTGTVVAAECCYGAELYNHTLMSIDPPICMSYLLSGAVAYVGSTNIAYGPPSGNGQADLITQFFLQNVLAGSSSGAALLLARQKFVQGQVMAGATNLKTLAQFILLGDPSLKPCVAGAAEEGALSAETSVTEAKGIARALTDRMVLAPGQHRKMRRVAIEGIGLALGASATRPGRRLDMAPALRSRLAELARSQNIEPQQMTLLSTEGGSLFRKAAKSTGVERRVATIVERSIREDVRAAPFIRAMVSHIVGDRIVRIEVSESR